MLRIGIIILFFARVTMAQETPLDSIPLSISFDEEVIVTGQYTPTDVQSSVLPIRIITKKMIEQRAATNLTEVLQQQSNVRVEQDPVLGTTLQMNGLSGQHIKVLIDGVPMIGRSDGNLDLDRIPVQDIERIEIIENAMSVAYGTNALGGTINIITKKGKQERPWNVRLLGQVQSNGQYNGSINLGGKWKGLSASLNYNYSHFIGFSEDTLRSQEWNPKQQHTIGARLNYQIPKTGIQLGYHFNYLNEKIDNKGIVKLAAFPELSYAKDYEFVTKTQDHSISALGYIDNKKRYYLDFVAGFNDFQREKNAYFRSLNDNPTPDVLDTLDSDTTAFQAWNVRATVASKYRKKIDFQVGLDIRYDYTTGARIAENRASLGDFAVFTNVRYRPIAKLTLDAGLRLAYNTLSKFPFTYSAGLKWKIMDGMNLRASYARGIRTPSLKELYLNFVDINHNIVGNPNLKPEYAHNIRLGWNFAKMYKNLHLVNVDIGTFYNHIDQQITLYSYSQDSLGNFVIDDQSTQYAYFNLEQYQNWGINTNIKYQIKGLTVQFGATLIGHYNRLSETHQESIKPFQYTLEFTQEVSYRFEKLDLTLSLFRRDYDKRISFAARTNPITQETEVVQNTMDGFALMDFTVSKGFFNGGLTIAAGVKNLLDIRTVNQTGASATAHSSGSGSFSVGMGRIFFGRLIFVPARLIKK